MLLLKSRTPDVQFRFFLLGNRELFEALGFSPKHLQKYWQLARFAPKRNISSLCCESVNGVLASNTLRIILRLRLTSSLQTFIEINSVDQLATKTYPRLRRFNRWLLFFNEWNGTLLNKERKESGWYFTFLFTGNQQSPTLSLNPHVFPQKVTFRVKFVFRGAPIHNSCSASQIWRGAPFR